MNEEVIRIRADEIGSIDSTNVVDFSISLRMGGDSRGINQGRADNWTPFFDNIEQFKKIVAHAKLVGAAEDAALPAEIPKSDLAKLEPKITEISPSPLIREKANAVNITAFFPVAVSSYSLKVYKGDSFGAFTKIDEIAFRTNFQAIYVPSGGSGLGNYNTINFVKIPYKISFGSAFPDSETLYFEVSADNQVTEKTPLKVFASEAIASAVPAETKTIGDLKIAYARIPDPVIELIEKASSTQAVIGAVNAAKVYPQAQPSVAIEKEVSFGTPETPYILLKNVQVGIDYIIDMDLPNADGSTTNVKIPITNISSGDLE
ncbi:MAG: hypothetical protein NUV67_04820 [archaeon]|nr:hypothetical protein [archaeon]